MPTDQVTAEDVQRLLEDRTLAPRADEENVEYFEENYRELQEEYPDEVVAVLEGGETVESSVDFDDRIEFFEYLEENYGEDATDRAFIEHVSDPETDYIPSLF